MTYRAKLLAYFKVDDLPKIYGGKCECEGGCVLGRAAHNVEVVKEMKVQTPSALTDIISLPNCGTENVRVHQRNNEQVDVIVSNGDLVTWCFSSLDKDIDFQVVFIPKDGLVQSLVPPCHVHSKASLIQGEWRCLSDGQLRLVFDNSKSSWYSCSVSYEINLLKGGEIPAEE